MECEETVFTPQLMLLLFRNVHLKNSIGDALNIAFVLAFWILPSNETVSHLHQHNDKNVGQLG